MNRIVYDPVTHSKGGRIIPSVICQWINSFLLPLFPSSSVPSLGVDVSCFVPILVPPLDSAKMLFVGWMTMCNLLLLPNIFLNIRTMKT